MEYDVVIVGGGAAGLTAAVVASKFNLQVLLVEKTEYFGGTMAYSSGVPWIPANHHMAGIGYDDSREKARTYLLGTLGNRYDEELVSAYLDKAPEMLEFMEANSEVAFVGVPLPDYQPWVEGATSGRGVFPMTYDGRQLGKHLNDLRPILPQLGVFGSMQIGPLDLPNFRKVLKTPSAFLYSAKSFARFARDLLLHGRGTRLVNGNALAGRLFKSALASSATLWNEAPVKRILFDNGRASGVVVEHGGREITVKARKGVILASGGFGANADMRRECIPMADAGWSLQPEGCQGDGIKFGIDAGGRFVTDNVANGNWVPMSSEVKSDGSRVNYPHFLLDRHCPGFIMVDPAGQRFANEAECYQTLVETMHRRGTPTVFLICDHPAQRAYGMGLARPAPFSVESHIRSGYLKKAATLAGLAAQIGVDAAVLAKTVGNYNRFAKEGEDPDFHRGEDAISAFQGDRDHLPNPCVGPIERGPFYAIEIKPGEFCTFAGLETNGKAQVLDTSGDAIPGLYAAGLDMNSITKGLYPGGGLGLGPAMTFGYVAAREVAQAA